MDFIELGLAAPITAALTEAGYSKPTPIQAASIPHILAGRDVMASAQTGTGKTASFVLPILHKLSALGPAKKRRPRALIVTPTRELAQQITDNVHKYSKHMSLRYLPVYGGAKIYGQINRLGRGVDLLVATPGRLLDLIQQEAVSLEHVSTLVLDEADRLLDMGFINDIKKIASMVQEDHQTLMFSATYSNEVKKLANELLNKPENVAIEPERPTAALVTHKLHPVDKENKTELLCHLLKSQQQFQVLVFSKTKFGADKLARKLRNSNFTADALHGDKSQFQRQKSLRQFKEGKVQVLVATDVAARGIDIQDLPQVINYDLPMNAEDYVHRIGRTGRAGKTGEAVSLVSHEDVKALFEIERLIQQSVIRHEIAEFSPSKPLPTIMKGKGNSNSRSRHRKPGRGFGGRSGGGYKGRSEGRSFKARGEGRGGFKGRSEGRSFEARGEGRGGFKGRSEGRSFEARGEGRGEFKGRRSEGRNFEARGEGRGGFKGRSEGRSFESRGEGRGGFKGRSEGRSFEARGEGRGGFKGRSEGRSFEARGESRGGFKGRSEGRSFESRGESRGGFKGRGGPSRGKGAPKGFSMSRRSPNRPSKSR